jgi:hypothetical protein
MAGTLYVKPANETEPCPHCGQGVPPSWQLLEDPDGEPLGEFDTRGEAKQAALDNRTDEAVVLLRADGSVHSEMRAATASAQPGQEVAGGTAIDGDQE